jgi:putative ABC transport system substrate-binding protein
MSYAGSATEAYYLSGRRLYRADSQKPADLRVQQTTRVELSVNLRTGKALGLEIR